MGYTEIDESVRTSPSVNQNRTMRPEGMLIHTTSGSSSLGWLMGGSAAAGSPASADYLIDRNGTRHKITPDGRFAYHAGTGQVFHNNRYYHDDQVSQLLIGVELEQDGEQDITREQYFSLAELTFNLRTHYGWAGDFPIYGHYATARPRGRRSDPCNFDWGVYRGILSDGHIQLPLDVPGGQP